MIGPRLPHTMTVFHPTGTDAWGAPAGTTTENVPCRIEYGNKMIRGPNGEQTPSRATITTQHPVVVGDTLILQGETAGQTALQMHRIDNLGGTELHREVYL